MTYQPKSYRKFLATSVAAAMVATVAAPMAPASVEASEAKFTDIAGVSGWAGDAIDYLVEKGAIEGVGNDKFDPTASLTRGAAAKILALTLDLDLDADNETTLSDLEGHWSEKYVAALQTQKPGVIDGLPNGTFNPNGSITRQEMAKMTVVAYGLELNEEADINFPDNTGWGRNYVDVLASLGVVEGANGKFNPNNNVSRAESVVFVHRTEVEEVRKAVPVKVVPVTDLAVVSVSAINAKQLEIKFNKPVDEDTVITDPGTTDTLEAGVFILQRIPAGTGSTANKNVVADNAHGKLSDDGMTLTVTADGSEFFNGKYTLSVVDNSIVSEDGLERIDGYTTTFDVNDTTNPTVKEVKFNAANKEITVVMSEPVEVYPAIRVNGSSTPVSVSPNATETEFSFTANDSLLGTTATLNISGAVDFASNALTTVNRSVTLTQEEGPVTVTSIKQQRSNVIRVEFNRAIAGATAAAAALNVENNVDVLVGITSIGVDSVSRVSGDKSNRTFDIVLDATGAPNYDFFGDRNSISTTVFFAENGLEDVFGNYNEADITKTVSMTRDLVAPTVQSHSVSNDSKEIRIKFNKNLTPIADSNQPDVFGVEVRRNGAPVDETTLRIEVKSNSDVLIIKRADGTKLANGDYQVRFTKGTDHTDTITDTHRNRIDSQTYQTIKITSSTSNVEVTGITTTGHNEFTVAFSNKVSDSALNPASYTLDGLTLPSNTDIYFTDGDDRDEVVITLPENTVNKGDITASIDNATLRVVSVRDTNNVSLPSYGSTNNVYVRDNTPAILTEARLIGDTIILTFDEEIDDTSFSFTDLSDVAAEFEIKRGATELDLDVDESSGDQSTVATSVDGKTLTITVTASTNTNWSAIRASGGTVTIKTADSPSITDENGLAIKEKVQVTFRRN